ncbi:MAG: hypothetical protein DCC68_09045 [Planctomycetota bacterium]|nr:MAG: hypothetical protein DCC68_09045 [Planctomycetota bacterium]
MTTDDDQEAELRSASNVRIALLDVGYPGVVELASLLAVIGDLWSGRWHGRGTVPQQTVPQQAG